MSKIYIIGSLRNPSIPKVGAAIRAASSWEVFDDWFGGGYEADDKWKEYEETRGRTYSQAIWGENARHIFEFDKEHLDSSDAAVLVTPAGKSGHLELGYMVGQGKRTYVLFDGEPERWDVMYRFVDNVFFKLEDLLFELNREMGSPVLETGGAYKSMVQRPEYANGSSAGQTGSYDSLGRLQRLP